MPSAQPNSYWQEYQTKTVWASSGDANSDQLSSGGLRQLARVQSTSFSIESPLVENVYLDSSVEPYNSFPPGVSADIRWLHTDGSTEYYIGLAKLNSSGTIVLGLEDEKNLYITMEDELGIDAIGAPLAGPRTVLGLGNAVMTAYEIGGRVGGLIESRATMSCLTANVYTGFSGVTVPSVNYQNGGSQTGRFIIPAPQSQYSSNRSITGQPAALGGQEMIMVFSQNSPFGAVLTGQNSCYLQSFNLGLSIDRQEQKPLGYVYPKARPIIYPIKVDLSAEAIVSKYQADTLERFGCNSTGFSIQMIVKQPCTNLTLFGFFFDNLQLQSQSINQSIGPMDTMNLKWRGWIRTPNDMFIDPSFNYIINLQTSGAYGEQW